MALFFTHLPRFHLHSLGTYLLSICYFFLQIVVLQHVSGWFVIPPAAHFWSMRLAVINSLLNPIIGAAMCKPYRKGYMFILCKCLHCCGLCSSYRAESKLIRLLLDMSILFWILSDFALFWINVYRAQIANRPIRSFDILRSQVRDLKLKHGFVIMVTWTNSGTVNISSFFWHFRLVWFL